MKTQDFYNMIKENHSILLEEVKYYMKAIKERYSLTDANMSEIFGVKKEHIAGLIDGTYTGTVDSTIITVMLTLGMPLNPRTEFKYSMTEIGGTDNAQNSIVEYVSSFHRQRMLDKIYALCSYLNLNTEDEIDKWLDDMIMAHTEKGKCSLKDCFEHQPKNNANTIDAYKPNYSCTTADCEPCLCQSTDKPKKTDSEANTYEIEIS